jgi:hypothetical protein
LKLTSLANVLLLGHVESDTITQIDARLDTVVEHRVLLGMSTFQKGFSRALCIGSHSLHLQF